MKKQESNSIKFSERIKKYRNDNNLIQTDLANIYIIKYNDWLVYNNSFYPAEIYYLVFSKEMIVIDDTWLTTLSQDIIDFIPLSSGEYLL